MITYDFIELKSPHLYEHLYLCIKEDIKSGKLKPNAKLPSKRNFSKQLGVSTITVENAYAQLLAEGYLYALPRKGYYISDISDLSDIMAIKQTQSPFGIMAIKHPPSPDLPLMHDEPATVTVPEYEFDFLNNHSGADLFPFPTWAKLLRTVITDKSVELLNPPPCGGLMELRMAISDYLYQFRRMSVKPEQIIIGAGTEYLYGLLIQLFDQSSVYAIEDPGYTKICKIYESNHVSYIPLPLDQDGIQLDALIKADPDILHISPSHHYPTGIMTPVKRRHELLRWAMEKTSRYIIEDDYDSEFRLTGIPIPSLQSIDTCGQVIYMNTFTKTLSPTIRISYMILPPALVDRFYENLGFYACTVSNFEQYTLARFIKDGYFEKHINRMRKYYKEQRSCLLNDIKKSPLSAYSTIIEEDAGLHFLLQINTTLSDDVLIERAHQNKIRISCLSQYYHTPNVKDSHTILINYSGIRKEEMATAIDRLYHCIFDSVTT
ncbi:MAG: PLP-dependent aminotransferase family protein [Clostridia bacterium]|nr:PLP-dependent aminotransferase family protein [Clostridia bacterium]